MEDSQVIAVPAVPGAFDPPGRPLPRWAAIAQTVLVCGIPTQVAIAAVLVLVAPGNLFRLQQLSLEVVSIISFIDTAVIALLIRGFLWLSGEDPKAVFIGTRPVRGEVLKGLAWVPVVMIAVTLIVLVLRTIAPGLHTVKTNPLERFMESPLEAAIFILVAVLAGGVREELQRAFILHRFEQRLGGVRVGLAVFSLTFGLLHVDQGLDVALAIGLLGLLWGLIFIRRRSVVLPMVNHAGFNALQVLQGTAVRMFGG